MWTSPQPMTAPFASGPGTRIPGDQYGWRTRPIEPGGVAATRSSNSDSASTPSAGRPRHLGGAELALEPLDHPVAAVDVDLDVVCARDGGRPRGEARDDLDIPAVRSVDGRSGAERDGADVGIERPGPEDLAGLVAGGRDQRQPDGNAGGRRRGGADRPERPRPAAPAPAASRARSATPATPSCPASPTRGHGSQTAHIRPAPPRSPRTVPSAGGRETRTGRGTAGSEPIPPARAT